MNEPYIQIPRAHIRVFIGQKRVANGLHVYGDKAPESLRTLISDKCLKSLEIKATYRALPRNLWDKVCKRTRYELVTIEAPCWGVLAESKQARAIYAYAPYSTDLSHLKMRPHDFHAIRDYYVEQL